MSDRNGIIQQMLQTNTKMLEKYMRENNAEQIAVYQAKVDKLRAQLDGTDGMSNPQSFSQPNYAAPAQTNQYSQPQQSFQPQYSQPPAATTYAPAAPSYAQPPAAGHGNDIARLDHEMQELRLANAKLREQLAQREDSISREARMHAMQAGEMNARIAELMTKQASFDTLLAEKQAKIEEIQKEHANTERRNNELLAQQNLKASAAYREKEREYEDAVHAIASQEESILNLTAEIKASEQAGAAQVKHVTEERDKLQESVDHARALIRQKQEQIDNINNTLAAIKRKQEDEAKAVGLFVSKSIGAIKVAAESAQTQSARSVEITAKANVGFANLTITTIVNEKKDQ